VRRWPPDSPQVTETLDDSVLAKMGAPPKPDVPIISANQLTEADGLIFGALCIVAHLFNNNFGCAHQPGSATVLAAGLD
jgi:hypothetical protein